MEQVSRFELPSQPWQGRILTTVLYLQAHIDNTKKQKKNQGKIANFIIIVYNILCKKVGYER